MTNFNGLKNDKQQNVEWQKIRTKHDTEELQICGFEKSYLNSILTYFSYILSLGWVRLFFHWYPRLHLYATHKKCPLIRATKLLIIDDYQGVYKSYFVKDVKLIGTKNLKSSGHLKVLGDIDVDLLNSIEGKSLSINLDNGTKREVPEYRAFWFKKQCYIWDETRDEFSGLIGLDRYVSCPELHLGQNKGLSKEDQLLRRIVYGNNEIIVPVQSILVLFLLEFLNPFYIFQVFTICVWFADGYYYYTGAIILMSVFSITSTIIQTRRNQKNLRGTVASMDMVRVKRSSGEFESISSSELVPGDIIELPRHQGTVMCDAVLLTGHCIVNESMLTGESVPVTKTPLTPRPVLYDSKECSQHTLYSGTMIIQTRYYGDGPVLARVIRTGLQTNRGALVAAILYPPPADFKFDQDSYKFIGILAIIALLGFIYTVISKASRGITTSEIVIDALDIITIVISPALPAAMTVGKLYAQTRLKKAQIYCINSRVINVSGSINCICFDKTGTLTEDGLDMWGAVPCSNGVMQSPEKDIKKLQNHPIFQGMLVSHSLTLIDNELCGDPLDVKMFESTGWILEEPEISDTSKYDLLAPTVVKPSDKNSMMTGNMNEISEIGIIEQYQFSSSLQRMSVIVRVLGSDHFESYTKGSPEVILSLSNPETIPQNIMTLMQEYTEQGYRVIAIGKNIIASSYTKIHKMHRDQIERNLEFLGLVILENRLKEPTIQVIEELREANINVLMITGDNIQTAVSVARECKILAKDETVIGVTVVPPPSDEKILPKIFYNVQGKPAKIINNKLSLDIIERGMDVINYRFALTGQTWQLLREYYPELVPKICVRGAVFARMTSDQKQQLVTELMQLGYYVAMCGDGANDCGALRAAHVGVSLSEAESSVASPFTSRIPDITCVPKVIRQGRAALVTSFGIFKFMVTYSLTEFISAFILYSIDSNLSDFQFLFIDIFLIVNFAFFFGKTKAYEGKLAKKPPMTSLLSFTPLFSLTLHMTVMLLFQLSVYYWVKQFDWYSAPQFRGLHDYYSFENYSVFTISMFQYITVALIFSHGKPYRRAVYTNNLFIISILISTLICLYITVMPANWVITILQLKVPPNYHWPCIIVTLSIVNFVICFFIEAVIIEYLIEGIVKPRVYRPEKSKKRYLGIQYDLKNQSDWPKINSELPVLPLTPSNDKLKTIADDCDNQVNAGFDNLAFENEDIKETTKF
ncbi:polyamine-transporting ATPase 13A3 isoform X2 [Microplitis demolitor]|uniref:polyamine-transporting ATPase 13A3 isoform X2 n=1 Tax=Microplitis demolitor TaxID=69319 RepID=UPI0004CD5C8D|nr:polyamine-transporting ATPase 13A3 isoform X2 [Microplitis demolitor]